MKRQARSSSRTVRDEMRVLDRLGFEYMGTDSAGHHVFEHPAYGPLAPMSSTPRNERSWRRRHREAVARLMGLNLFQFERLIAGQPINRQQPRRRRTQRDIRKRQRTPVALLMADPPRRQPTVCVAVPNPGTDEAQAAGCICPVFGNRHGRGVEGRDGVFEYVRGCPLHIEELAA